MDRGIEVTAMMEKLTHMLNNLDEMGLDLAAIKVAEAIDLLAPIDGPTAPEMKLSDSIRYVN